MRDNWARLVQSSLAYAAAALMAITLHEFAHGLMAVLAGQNPTVFALHEQDFAGSRLDIGLTAAAGPITSLVLGVSVLRLYRRFTGQGFARYLALWFGLFSTAVFLGYLMTAPFFSTGDVAVVIGALHWGVASTWLSFLLGAIGIVLLSRLALPHFLKLTNRDLPLRGQMMSLALLSWIGGSVILLVAILPTPPLMAVAIGLFVPLINFLATRRDATVPYGEPGATPALSLVSVGLLTVLVVLEQTVLKTGVRL